MASHTLLEGEFVDNASGDDPDLNQAFWDFSESIKQEADAGGSVAVFEIPTDANGTPRPTTYNKTKLFTVPIGSCTLDDICDRVLREFVEPGGKIMIQLLARKNGERGIKLNRMIPLKRSKNSNADSGTNASQIENLMRMMNEQRARDLADMRSMIEQTRAPTIDPLTQSLAITEKLTAMAVAMRTGQAPGAVAPASDPNNLMNQMMTMMMTSMMKKFMNGMDGAGEPKEDTNSWMKDILQLAKPLLEQKAAAEKTNAINAQRMLRHESAQPVAPASAESNADAPKTPTEPTDQEKNDMKLLALLNSALPMLIDGVVMKDGSPADTAKLLMSEIPEDDTGLNDALYSLIQAEPAEFNRMLCLADKRAAAHVPWFEQLRVALLAEFDPDTRVPQTGNAPA